MFHVVHTFSKWPVWSNHRSYYCEIAHEQLLNYLAWVMNNSCMVKLGRRTYNCWQWLVRGNRRRTKATFHSLESNFVLFWMCTLENMMQFRMSWQFLIQEDILGEIKSMNIIYCMERTSPKALPHLFVQTKRHSASFAGAKAETKAMSDPIPWHPNLD